MNEIKHLCGCPVNTSIVTSTSHPDDIKAFEEQPCINCLFFRNAGGGAFEEATKTYAKATQGLGVMLGYMADRGNRGKHLLTQDLVTLRADIEKVLGLRKDWWKNE